MATRTQLRSLSLLKLFERFVKDSRRGRRLQPNGNRISSATLCNYQYTLRIIKYFCIEKGVFLRIRPTRNLSDREFSSERVYWKNFYRQFSDYLYDDCGYFDNYVGQIFKHIRTFFNYLDKDLGLGIGSLYKSFFVRREEIAIFPLMPEELNFLIYNNEFEATLKPRMKEVKDFFVFGCTVALRFSDLVGLKKSNIRIVNAQHYLFVRSIKTNTDSLIRLPGYAVEIIKHYAKLKNRLLPKFNKSNLNKFIKRLLELAGFKNPIQITRDRKGIPVVQVKKGSAVQNTLRFCDVASTHTMRRTAITTMLSLGIPEQMVRKISGHSPSSKEFYRYVFWVQTYQDLETEKMFEKLESKKLELNNFT